jgi:hypothetical protein
MFANLHKSFEKIGADVSIHLAVDELVRNRRMRQTTPVRLDISTKKGVEIFEVSIRKEALTNLELSIIEVRPQDKHLLLLSRQLDSDGAAVNKEHFLCGHDERHLFVASVEGVSTVAAAKASLKPKEILHREVGLSEEKRNRRKTKAFRRQGEWFFIPASLVVPANLVRSQEPLVRGNGSKAHIAQYAYRARGETVMVCSRYPQGLTESQYKALIARDKPARFLNWRQMVRNAGVFVRGTIRHPDHATIVLEDWHRVLMNTEARTEAVAFLD